jgi:hypothetical protein
MISNIQLACFHFSSEDMAKDDEGILDNINVADGGLERKEKPVAPELRPKLVEALHHLYSAYTQPGLMEWMKNGVSAPFEAGALPAAVRIAWSDSPGMPDVLDADSLIKLRNANRVGALRSDIIKQGISHRARKSRSSTKRRSPSVAGIPSPSSAASMTAGMGGPGPTADHPGGSPDDVRPLPSTLKIISRSSKLNFVLQQLLSAPPSDKFIIWGEPVEFGHLTEALDLFEIGW